MLMKVLFAKKFHKTISAVAMVLSVAFALLIIGPVFLYAYDPPTSVEEIEALNNNLHPNEVPSSYDQAVSQNSPSTYDPSIFDNAQKPTGFDNPLNAEREAGAAKAAADSAKNNQSEDLAKGLSCYSPPFHININACIASVMETAMWLSARTLWISGVLLNITLNYTLNLNTILERLPIVDIGWKVLRDIANIVFIFITLWCGISITLGIGDNGKKAWGYLAQMVLVALFMNFSLFIAKAVVDVSNIAALHFYSLIIQPDKQKDYDSGLSEAFMYGLKLSTLYNIKEIQAEGAGSDVNFVNSAARNGGVTGNLSWTNIILIGFFGSLFIIVCAWVFFAAAIMFIYRAITLIILMMLSPLAFVGLILPGASGMAHAWWSKLWSQAFFAPLYLALAYVVVRTINAPAFKGVFENTGDATKGFAAAVTGTAASNVAVIFNFVILIGLMVGCLIVAQSLGAHGSEMAMAGWEKIKGAAVGGVVGIAGASARGLIKAPSAGIQAVGNVGAGASGLGKWMASTKLLNNRFLKDTALTKKVAGWGGKLSHAGEEFHEKGFGSKMRKVTSKAEFLDPRYLEERASQSKLGQTMVGRALRGVTTGALANVKIGKQSLEEAYQEGEEMSSKRREIGYGNTARENAKKLEPLHEKEQKLMDEKLKAEVAVNEAEKQLKEAEKLSDTDPTKTEKKNEAKTAITAAKGEGFTSAKKELEAAKALPDTDPDKDAKVADAQDKMNAEREKGGVAVAEDAVENFQKQNRKEMEGYTVAIQYALGQMSTEAFLNLPKVFFENPAFMDEAVLGQDKFGALMKSEHFTKTEKEEYSRARWKRAEEVANRRRVRNDRYLEELPEYQKKLGEQKEAKKRVDEELKRDFETIDTEIKDATEAFEKAQKALASAVLPEAKKTAQGVVDEKQTQLDELKKARATIEADAADKKRELEKNYGLRDKKTGEEILLKKPEQPGWDEAPDIRKALRNILRPEEVINLYRYNRKAFGNPMIADTIKQGTWNLVRNSGEVDSNSIEQIARVQKRHYIKDSLYFGSGLDPIEMHKLEAEDLTGAYELLNELGDKMKKLGFKGYREWIEKGELRTLLKDMGLEEKLSADVNVQLNRHDTGQTMYKLVAPNLSSDEFEMMPGMMREHPMSLNYYDQASITTFSKRDIENTLPMAEFFIEQFKRDTEQGGGVISEGNLRILKWFVNENQGQGFTQFGMIREDLKDTFERIKRLIGKSARAMTTPAYATKDDVLDAIERETGKRYDPFERIRSKEDMK